MTKEIDVRNAMRVSGYSRTHLYTLIFSERIRARKVRVEKSPGYRLLIELASLEEYLREQGVEARVQLIES